MNKIVDNGQFIYRAEISRPPHPLDSFHLLITSQLLGTRFPTERRHVFDVTLTRGELTRLRDVIDVHLLEVV
jgi:hypothetical protein